MNYLEVEGHPGLVRDKNTGVVLNTNEQEVEAARARKKAWKQKQKELEELKNDVSELKVMMKQILEKI